MITALVTGGAGFIGSHLAETLCHRGVAVRLIDDLSLGHLDNLAWRRPQDAVEFVQGDVRDAKLMARLVAGCDWVFHEAALPSVPFSVAEPVLTNEVNLAAAVSLMAISRAAGVRRFVFASSSAVYGDSDAPIKKEDQPADPLSPYALQKHAGERYAAMFHRFHGLETVCLRYFNVFGPRQSFDSPYSGVIAKFCTALLGGQAPILFGDGLQSRDFVYIENVVAANLRAAEAPAERVAGRVFNIGSGASISLLQLLAELNRLVASTLTPRFEPARTGDVRSSCADLEASRRDLDYRVTVPWREGLERTLAHYRKSCGAVGT
ncbi:MAG: NAD-dependent epimerase/dehydratase family protein [Limisphaerales bacterium]